MHEIEQSQATEILPINAGSETLFIDAIEAWLDRAKALPASSEKPRHAVYELFSQAFESGLTIEQVASTLRELYLEREELAQAVEEEYAFRYVPGVERPMAAWPPHRRVPGLTSSQHIVEIPLANNSRSKRED